MKDTQFIKLIEGVFIGSAFIAKTPDMQIYLDDLTSTTEGEIQEINNCFTFTNDPGKQLSENAEIGEIFSFEHKHPRDIQIHRAYMGFLSYVWDFLPKKFKYHVSKNIFYNWLKMLRKDYKILYEFKNPEREKEIFQYFKELRQNKKKYYLSYKDI